MSTFLGIFSWIVFGFVVGLFARAVTPGPQKMGFLQTTLLGIGGALVGGLIANLLMGEAAFAFAPAGFLGSVIGSVLLLLVLGLVFGKRATPMEGSGSLKV